MTQKNSSVFSTRRSLLVAGAATLAAPLVLRAQSPAKVIRIGSPDLGTAGKPSPGGSVFAVLQANKWLEDEFAKDGIKIEWNFFRGQVRRCTRRCRPSSSTSSRWATWPL